MKRVITIISSALFAYQVSQAATIKDYGTRGHVFPIIEESLLEVIMAKLNAASKSGLLNQMQLEFQEKVSKKS
ncbi:putative type-F conjugative transfer system protein TraW [Orientia tsutsugamushi str. Kato PP]|nr:putative type-F conjugative transfer system protein TraW [Orientia tsutsugamushi str. Kato PP]